MNINNINNILNSTRDANEGLGNPEQGNTHQRSKFLFHFEVFLFFKAIYIMKLGPSDATEVPHVAKKRRTKTTSNKSGYK